MKENSLVIAGTGHRPDKLGGYTKEAYLKLKRVAEFWLSGDRYRVDKVVSGMALGWDIALAHAAIELGLPVIAAIPFQGQELYWPKQTQMFYRHLLKGCKDVRIISEGSYDAWKMQKRNIWMVDNADLLLAVWDGSKGGTKNCVDYAKKTGTHIVNLYDHLTR